MKQKCQKRILVSLPLLAHQHRQGLEGILDYIHKNHAGTWLPILDTELLTRKVPKGLNNGKFDGVLVYVSSDEIRQQFAALGVPTVFFEPFLSLDDPRLVVDTKVFSVVPDYVSEGRFAARYFLERHYENFAYFGGLDTTIPPNVLRHKGFIAELAYHGFTCATYKQSNHEVDDLPRLGRWLRKLPQHTGLFAVRDSRAVVVISAASQSGVRIPEHVAVLGIDNDEYLCKTCVPSLSSISTDIHSLGYKCGLMLDELMSGRQGKPIVHVPNLRVETRTSTELDAVNDLFVAKALSWIRNHLADNPTAKSVSDAIGYSARQLNTRFRKTIGTTIGAEIRRLRLEQAIFLLKTTEMDISRIADECGFSGASHLGIRVRETTGFSPSNYRRS